MPFRFVSWATYLILVKNKTRTLSGMAGITHYLRVANLASRKAFTILTTLFLLLPADFSHGAQGEHPSRITSSTNVILFIGDGMDEHQITMARSVILASVGAPL